MRFSSDFELNSESCYSLFFLSQAKFQLCHALFVVQCSFRGDEKYGQGMVLNYYNFFLNLMADKRMHPMQNIGFV